MNVAYLLYDIKHCIFDVYSFADTAAADNQRCLLACDTVVRTVDADADVDETVPCSSLNSSSLSPVSCLYWFALLNT